MIVKPTWGILSPGPTTPNILAWPMFEESGQIIDTTGQGRNGILGSNITRSRSIFGPCIHFPGTDLNSKVTLPSITLTKGWLSFWLRIEPTSPGVWGLLIGTDSATGIFYHNGAHCILMYPPGHSNPVLEKSTWIHFHINFEPSTTANQMLFHMYKNGEFYSDTTMNLSSFTINQLGNDNANERFFGQIDGLMIHSGEMLAEDLISTDLWSPFREVDSPMFSFNSPSTTEPIIVDHKGIKVINMIQLFKNSTSFTDYFVLVNASGESAGLPKTGVTAAQVTASYSRTRGARTAITPVALTTSADAFTSGGWIEVDATNQPGLYRFDIPNAAFAAGADKVIVTIKATDSRTEHKEYVLTEWNDQLDYKLDKLFSSVCGPEDPVDNSYAAKIASKDGNFTTFNSSTDALEGILDSIGSLSPISSVAASSTLTTGTTIAGTHVSTHTDDNAFYTLAPVNPGGLNAALTFSLGNNRVPTSLAIAGYFQGANATGVHVEIYNAILGAWDRLTNTTTWMANRTTESTYAFPLSRQHVNLAGEVLIRWIGTTTTTTHRLFLDRVLLYHITEVGALGGMITPEQIWSYGTRTLSASGDAEPVTPPTPAAIATQVRTELTTELARIDTNIGSRSVYAGADTAGTTTLLGRLTALRAGYLDNLNVGGLVASSAETTSIQNNTTTVRVVPSALQRPTSGSTTYRIELLLYGTGGAMEVPDSIPTLDVVNSIGTSRITRLDSTTMTLISPGRYRSIYTASPTDELEQLLFFFTVVEGGTTRIYGNASIVVDTIAADFTIADRTMLSNLDSRLTTQRATNLDNLNATISSRSTYDGNDTAGTTTLLSRLSAGRATNLDNLDALVSSRSVYAGADTAGTGILLNRLTQLRAGYLDNLNVGGLVAASNEVTSIQNNTTAVRVVPDTIQRPTVGTATYRIELLLYGAGGAMEAPDAAPTIDVVNSVGTSRASRLDSTTMTLVSTGRYRSIYTASAGDILEELLFFFSVIEGGNTRVYGNATIVVDVVSVDFTATDRTKLDSLESRLTAQRATNLDNLDALVSSDTAGITTLLSRLSSTRATKLDFLDVAISTRSTYVGVDTTGVTTLLGRLTAPRATNLDNLDAPISGIDVDGGTATIDVDSIATRLLVNPNNKIYTDNVGAVRLPSVVPAGYGGGGGSGEIPFENLTPDDWKPAKP